MDIHFQKSKSKRQPDISREVVEISNGIVRLVFDGVTGNLIQITDKGLGRDALQDPRGNRLVKLVGPNDNIGSEAICSHDSGKPQIEKKEDYLTINYPQLYEGGRPIDISALVTVRLPAGSWEAFFTLELINNSSLVIEEIHFPWIGGWTGFAGRGIDEISISAMKIDPYSIPWMRAYSFHRVNKRRFISSDFLRAPFFDISGGGFGISYNLYSHIPRVAGFVIDDLSPDYQHTCLSWAWVSFPFLRSGQRWTSPEVGVGVHRSDWHESATRLRRSMEKWWTPPKIPSRLRETIGIHHIQFTSIDGESYHDFSEIPAIAEDCMKYGVNDLCVWDQQGWLYVRQKEDNGFWDYSPLQRDKLQTGISKAQKLGCHVTTLIDYMYLTERSRLYPKYKDELLLSFYGKPITEPYSRWGGEHANPMDETREKGACILCDNSPMYHELVREVTQQALDFGFEGIFIDGATAWRLCHAKNHGHQTPDDTLEGCVKWIAEISHMVKERNPEGYLIGEGQDRFNNQILEMYATWWQPEDHTEALQYVWPEILLSWFVNESDRDVIPRVFAMNQIFSTMITNVDGYLSKEPEFAMHIARLAKLRQDTKRFLACGTFLDNRGLRVEGGVGHVYTSSSGLAVAVGNKLEKGCKVQIELTPEILGLKPNKKGLIYIEGISEVEVEAKESDGLLTMEIALPAYGSGVWCIPNV